MSLCVTLLGQPWESPPPSTVLYDQHRHADIRNPLTTGLMASAVLLPDSQWPLASPVCLSQYLLLPAVIHSTAVSSKRTSRTNTTNTTSKRASVPESIVGLLSGKRTSSDTLQLYRPTPPKRPPNRLLCQLLFRARSLVGRPRSSPRLLLSGRPPRLSRSQLFSVVSIGRDALRVSRRMFYCADAKTERPASGLEQLVPCSFFYRT